MSKFAEIYELTDVLRETLSTFEAAALLNSEFQLLGMKYETLPDVGTFAPVTQVVTRYFKLKEGEVVLTNDPYSGSSILSVMSLITLFKIGDQDFYFTCRTRFKPKLARALRLEDEGIRIPPTPIAAHRKLNSAVMEAISGHPQCPQGFTSRMEAVLEKLWLKIDLLKKWGQKNPLTFHRSTQAALIEETRSRILKRLSDLPHGETRMTLAFETGESIRLHTEIMEDQIHFEFDGTSQSKRLFLTDHLTYGTCLGAVLAFLGEDFLLNDGIYPLINVTTPQGCFLNAKYPSPIFEGMAEASSLLATAVLQSLSEITSSRSFGTNGAVPIVLSFEFSPELIYFDYLSGGSGASSDLNGIDSHYFWSLTKLQTSVEEIETLYPLQIQQTGIRSGSGGRGAKSGGNGAIRDIRLRQDCILKWVLGHRNTEIKNLKGALQGLGSELSVITANGEQKTLTQTSYGEIQLKAGDRVIAASGGGGGFGKPGDYVSKDGSKNSAS